jgi:hypothetical protein
VHAVVPEHIPAYVVTDAEAISSFLMALLSLSAIRAYELSGLIAMARGQLKRAFVPTPSTLLAVAAPATKLVTLDDIIIFWIMLPPQLGTNANVPSNDIATAPTFNKFVLKEIVVTSMVTRSTFRKVYALFWDTIANAGCVPRKLTATTPLLDMYPLAYPVGAVPNTAVSQVE